MKLKTFKMKSNISLKTFYNLINALFKWKTKIKFSGCPGTAEISQVLLHCWHSNCGLCVGYVSLTPQLCNRFCLGVEFDALLAVASGKGRKCNRIQVQNII